MTDAERIRQLEAENALLRRRCAEHDSGRAEPFPFAATLMQLPIPLTIYTPHGLAIAVNQAQLDLYRITSEEIVEQYNIFNDPEAHRRGDVISFSAACNGVGTRSAPAPYHPPHAGDAVSIEEHIFWSSMWYFPIRDAAGQIAWIGELTFDVTDQIRSNTSERHLYEALAERDRRFRALFDNNGLAIALVDATGRLIETNAALCRMLGLTIAQLRGNPMGTYTHPDDVAEDKRLFAEMVSGQRSFYQFEKRYRHADGSIVYARLTNSTIRDESGRVQFVMRLIEDITARREAEAALHASRTLLHKLIDELPAYVYAKDLQGRYLLVNQRVAQTMGRPIEAILQRTNQELLAPAVAAALDAHDAGLLQSGTTMRFSESYGEGEQARYFESVKFVLTDEHGQPYATCGISTETTEQRRAEQERLAFERQLHETQKLESLGLMAGGIAHDFNNLLVTILGNASLALEELPTDGPARQSLQHIELAARRAADLTRQMLTYAGKSALIFQPVDLNQMIEETARLLQSSIPRHVTLRFALTPDLPPVNGDPTQLRQIVMNLALNGAEAIDAPGGEVVVHTTIGRIDQARVNPTHAANLTADPYVILTVTDTGSGMDAATRERIFEPFFTTKFTGRGLGLAAVLGIVRSHQGAILVESAVGAGSQFQVFLPIYAGDTITPTDASAAPAAAQLRGTVLSIDDEPDVRAITSRMLGRLGLDVLIASNAAEALTILREHADRMRLILIDVTMPDLAGPELAQALLALQPTARFLVMSGHSEQEALNGFPSAAIAGFLAKPFTFNELATQVRAALTGP